MALVITRSISLLHQGLLLSFVVDRSRRSFVHSSYSIEQSRKYSSTSGLDVVLRGRPSSRTCRGRECVSAALVTLVEMEHEHQCERRVMSECKTGCPDDLPAMCYVVVPSVCTSDGLDYNRRRRKLPGILSRSNCIASRHVHRESDMEQPQPQSTAPSLARSFA